PARPAAPERIVPGLLRTLSSRFPGLRPHPGQSAADWLGRFTRNRTVHGLVDNVCGSFFAVPGNELPADVFLHYMADGSAFKKLGFVPGGTIEVWKPLADYVTTHGGDVWLNTPATAILVEGGQARGATVERGGQTITVHADTVISNIGPAATVG